MYLFVYQHCHNHGLICGAPLSVHVTNFEM